MATSLSDLIAQKEALERQIREAQTTAKAGAIAQVRKLMTDHDLTVADLVPQAKRQSPREGSKVAPKYRDPATGSTWTGRGLKPKWLSAALANGKSVEDFLI
jgi:DNA-binding protein H-NS